MKRKVILLVLLILLLLSQGLCLNVSATSGNEYLEWPEEIRGIYVLGLMEMYFFMTFMKYSELVEDIIAKTDGMSGLQIRKIFEKYLAENPEYWHYAAADIFFWAMDELLDD